MPPVWKQNGSHRLLPSTSLPCPLYSEISQGVKCEPVWCCRCTASGCWSAAASPGHSTGAAAKRMIFARRKVTQAALYGALRWWCRTDTHRALAFVAHALQGPLLTRLSSILGCEMRWILEICMFLKLCLSESFIHLLLCHQIKCLSLDRTWLCPIHLKPMLITKWWWLFVWVLVGSAQRRKKQCSLARQTCAYTSPCCRLTFCHDGDQSLILFSLLFLFLFFSLLFSQSFVFYFKILCPPFYTLPLPPILPILLLSCGFSL